MDKQKYMAMSKGLISDLYSNQGFLDNLFSLMHQIFFFFSKEWMLSLNFDTSSP